MLLHLHPNIKVDTVTDITSSEHPSHPRFKFKNELCINYMITGTCKYGDSCAFAHGEHELERTDLHRKCKTKECNKSIVSGYCPNGERCMFIHRSKDHINYSQLLNKNCKNAVLGQGYKR